ncbi:hypothetical protein [Clostridium botulinum]|uniref:hypothetical protein n=1 Tax=Clostridium botulinum TaxID=1491 RepID=UPI001C9B2854|nr:hypothetical protein [Clostridium botulinum]MBY6836926.1 hypothetical protein [Clostridium botulinum]
MHELVQITSLICVTIMANKFMDLMFSRECKPPKITIDDIKKASSRLYFNKKDGE